MEIPKRSPQRLQSTFHHFAERECKEVSPLYFKLSKEVADDPYLLQLAAQARPRQPLPNLFFGVVHYLLLRQPDAELAQFYPSITRQGSKEIPISMFREFCREQEDQILALIRSKIVQTNAINRTAYLMPIASARFATEEDITVVDIGCSSGLVMNFDQYRYAYDDQPEIGVGPVLIQSTLRQGVLPSFPKMIRIKQKIGIDQHPLDITLAENADWLKALIWPDLLQRFRRMESAIALAKNAPFSLVKGDTIADFKRLLESIDEQNPLLVYHTHVLYQFYEEERVAFRQMLDELGTRRNFLYLAVEGQSVFDQILPLSPGIHLVLTTYQDGQKNVEYLGQTNGHANWIKWIV